jgi:hypothetical protein
MILKTLRVKKKASFGRLVNYVMTHENKLRKGFLLTHNVMADDIAGITEEFHQNDDYRTNKRKNSVLMYHEIMSFAPEDSEQLTAEILEDIAQEYINMRSQKALGIAKPHFEKSHWHIHFLFSGTEYRSNDLLRMDNKKFEQIRRGIETYQQERYPELTHSIVYTDKPERERLNQKQVDKNVRKEKAYQAQKNGRVLDKERLSKAVQEMYARSKDTPTFLKFLNDQPELESYKYRGKLAGIKYGKNKSRKYRFTTLGITKEMLLALEQGKKKASKEPTFLGSIFRDEELARYLKKNRSEKQQVLLEDYKTRREKIDSLAPQKRPKAMKTLLENILDHSKTMNQFLFFLPRVGLEPIVVDQKITGVKSTEATYLFGDIGLKKILEKKQQDFRKYQARIEKYKKSKEGLEASQTSEIDLYLGGGGLFIF